MYSLALVTPPAAEPLSLAEAKLHLKVEIPDDDALIGSLITAARLYVERSLGRQLVTATWRASWDRFPRYGESQFFAPISDGLWDQRIPPTERQLTSWFDRTAIVPPLSPLQAVTSLTYYDQAGVLQTLDASLYLVDIDSDPGRVMPAPNTFWPLIQQRMNAVTLTFVAGYGAAAAVPDTLKTAIRFLIGHWYVNRESVAGGGLAEVPQSVDALLGLEWDGDYS